MRKACGWMLVPLLLVLALVPAIAAAQNEMQGDKKPAAAPAAPAAPAAGDARSEILFQINAAREKLVSLAEAMPAEKYSWRPGEGVRSVGEVFLHVAGGNYFIPTLVGAKPPEGIDMRNMEKDSNDKAKVVDTLKKSFDSVEAALKAVPAADLDKKVKIFDRDGSEREVFLLIATHAHEHLGQSIAYARMNGVVPPWSVKSGQ